MTVTSVEKNPDALTMTVTSEFEAPIERVWELWANPRLLERWWGPPTYPATFTEHSLVEGGRIAYYMTGPEGDQPHGWWRVVAVEPPRRLEFEDGFADETGRPDPSMPVMSMAVTLTEAAGGVTRMMIETRFGSVAEMEQVLSMGMEEGISAALGQIDGLLAGASL